MPAIRNMWLLLGVFLAGGCIDPYTPKISEPEDLMVINGRITDREGFHFIEVSRTSTIYSDEGSNPVSGCTVEIEDERVKSYPFREINPGIYRGWMESTDLIYGNSYKLSVITPEGKTYESEFEELLRCPPIEDISWDIQVTHTSDPAVSYPGVPFYITTDATWDYAKNYMWELEETWKYRSRYPIMFIWVGGLRQITEEPSDSLRTCYRTLSIPEIYTYSTRNISGGYIRRFPINTVSSLNDRLSIRYSLLARQYSLTDRAYDFWKALEGQAKQSGELYETQPVMIRGNIVSRENPGETVLGLFFATAVTEKRIYIKPDLVIGKDYCGWYIFPNMDLLWAYLKTRFPDGSTDTIFLLGYPDPEDLKEDTVLDYVENQACFDCRLKGGSLIPPWFWKDE
jgi:hypothetical protein